MSMTLFIRLTVAGANVGPTFSLFSDADGYTSAFAVGVPLATLYPDGDYFTAPDGTTTVRIVHEGGVCDDLYLPVATTTSTSTSSTSTSTSTSSTSTSTSTTTTSSTTAEPSTTTTSTTSSTYRLSVNINDVEGIDADDGLGGTVYYTIGAVPYDDSSIPTYIKMFTDTLDVTKDETITIDVDSIEYYVDGVAGQSYFRAQIDGGAWENNFSNLDVPMTSDVTVTIEVRSTSWV